MKKKLLVLIVFIIILLAVVGVYMLLTKNDIEPNKQIDLIFEDDNLIKIKGGTFKMGSPASERQRESDETEHEVTISDFYVDPYEVTQKSYEEIMGNNPSRFKGENLPVENVTWYDAIEYCNKLSESKNLEPVYIIDGKDVTWNRSANGYRLLTEAEWEYVARAGTTGIFNVSNYITSEQANFYGRYPYLIEENYTHHTDKKVVVSEVRNKTIEVNSLDQNNFGLYNTLGNVSEWVFDYYGEYNINDKEDPSGATTGHLRVNRGGGYNDYGKHLRCAYRSATNPIDVDDNLGFRIARNLENKDETIKTTYDLNETKKDNPKILVAYFSYSGNTKNASKIIADKTKADLVEIEMEHPYSGNIYDESQKDLNNYNKTPIKTKINNMSEYDIILLGYPNWWATIPMPIVTFLTQYNLSGKTIIPFVSHGGTIFGDSVSDVSKLAPNSYIGLGLEYHYSGGSSLSNDISNWLKENNIKER